MPDDNGAPAAPPARLEELRALVDDALRGDCAATAVWYADKLATLSRGAVEDELRLARAYAAGGDPARAARLLEARLGAGPGAPPRPLVAQFRRGDRSSTAAPELRARLLAARCLARCGATASAARRWSRPCATSRRPTTARCRGRAAALQRLRRPLRASTSRRRRARAWARPTRPWRTGRGASRGWCGR